MMSMPLLVLPLLLLLLLMMTGNCGGDADDPRDCSLYLVPALTLTGSAAVVICSHQHLPATIVSHHEQALLSTVLSCPVQEDDCLRCGALGGAVARARSRSRSREEPEICFLPRCCNPRRQDLQKLYSCLMMRCQLPCASLRTQHRTAFMQQFHLAECAAERCLQLRLGTRPQPPNFVES